MESCTCSTKPKLLFACSGGSNVGQIANDACRKLTSEGHGRMFCLAGIGGHVSGIVESSKSAEKVVAVDGCGVNCALKALEAAGVPVTDHIILTEWGIEKDHELYPNQGVIDSVKDRIIAQTGV